MKARKSKTKLTRFELEMMEALWRVDSGSVREILELLPENKRPAYTTVQTMIHRLEEKGAVRRIKKIGNAHVFQAVISRREAHRQLVSQFLEVFGGSVRPLMAHLVEIGKISLEDVRELEGMVMEEPESEHKS